MSIIRADSIKNRIGSGAPDFPNGITVTGVVTATTLNSVTNNIDVDDFISVGNNIHLGNAGVITATSGNFTGNVSIGGTLTYEDVKNVDSIGIVTARTGVITPNVDVDDFISVGSNIHLGNAGVVTATAFHGDGSNLTGVDSTALKDSGGNVKIQAQASGSMFTGIHTFTGHTFHQDNDHSKFGTGGDMSIYHDNTHNYIDCEAGTLKIRLTGAADFIELQQDRDVWIKGNPKPWDNNTYDLGTSSYRWRNIYTQDLQLSNEAKKDEGGNDVDGTWGDWTLQEGENDIFMINNRSGKKFKINLTEV